MRKFYKNSIIITLAVCFGFIAPIVVSAAGPAVVDLGTASNFVILSKTAVTTTGVTLITGDIGISPAFTTNIAGFSLTLDGSGTFSTSALIIGKVYAANHTAPTPTSVGTAVSAMEAAYTDASGRAPGVGVGNLNVGGGTLNGQNFVPGTYTWDTPGNVSITGDITLTGSASDVWIFQVLGTLGIDTNKKILLSGGALPTNIFWVVAGTTTLSPGSVFNGIILAGPGASTIALQDGAVLYGRALGQTDVTLIGNAVSVPATLHVIKHVINDNGGVATASSFTLNVKLSGSHVVGSPAVGVGLPGRPYTLSAGTYVVSEDIFSGYTSNFSGDCDSSGSITLTAGQDKTCTIANNDSAPSFATLYVMKHVVNDNSGVATANAWNLAVTSSNGGNGTGNAVGAESPGTFYTLEVGKAYSVLESGGPSGYIASFSSDCTIASAIVNTNYVCTVTNDDIVAPATINVVKIVVNDNGGTKVVADFALFVSGTPVVSGATNTFSAPATYTVTETSDSHYNQVFSGDCSTGGIIVLAPGNNKFCIITNNDIAPVSGGGYVYVLPVPPLIEIIKIPSPLALPAGPGLVKYTYTLRNIGTVPVSNISLVGDTCTPIVLVSGAIINSYTVLGVNETWVYTCSTVLSKTHTNIVTATGWANGISATDIASATVVVGAPLVAAIIEGVVVPPLIHVVKIPNPFTLPAGGGMVTYTNKVTNLGAIALSNVSITDDKCSPLTYISGDTNNDVKLDDTETWTYQCKQNLIRTTVNTVTAIGEANGLTAKDFAIVTVVVADPGFPDAGVHSKGGNTIVNSIIVVGILVLSSFYLVRKKQTI